MECVLILHNIRSIHNVGSLFRSADGAGVSRLFLTGYTPAPLDRFGRARQDLSKVALGAEKAIPWEKRVRLSSVTKKLQQKGFEILALEQHPRSRALFDFTPQGNIALILGNEVRGLSPANLQLADHILEIPMQGRLIQQADHPRQTGRGKESLNVSVAGGIALFALANSAKKL